MMRSARTTGTAGYTLLELMLVAGVIAAVAGLAVPVFAYAIDEIKTAMAARHLASRLRNVRIDAVRRAAAVGFKFDAGERDYVLTPYADGNGNGIRTADIRGGDDPPIGAAERLEDNFGGVRFGLLDGAPDADGQASGPEGLRIGLARILTFSPDGTATPGTLYVRGRRAQYAVRVFGTTGRTRVLRYRAGARTWTQ